MPRNGPDYFLQLSEIEAEAIYRDLLDVRSRRRANRAQGTLRRTEIADGVVQRLGRAIHIRRLAVQRAASGEFGDDDPPAWPRDGN